MWRTLLFFFILIYFIITRFDEETQKRQEAENNLVLFRKVNITKTNLIFRFTLYISPFTTNLFAHDKYCSSLTAVFSHKRDPVKDMVVLTHATIMLTLAFSLSSQWDDCEGTTPKATTGRNSDTMWPAIV